MVLHRQPPSLKHLLIQLPHSLIRTLLVAKLDVSKALAQPAVVSHNPAIRDLTKARKLGLELRRSDFEEQIADVEDPARLDTLALLVAGEGVVADYGGDGALGCFCDAGEGILGSLGGVLDGLLS